MVLRNDFTMSPEPESSRKEGRVLQNVQSHLAHVVVTDSVS